MNAAEIAALSLERFTTTHALIIEEARTDTYRAVQQAAESGKSKVTVSLFVYEKVGFDDTKSIAHILCKELRKNGFRASVETGSIHYVNILIFWAGAK